MIQKVVATVVCAVTVLGGAASSPVGPYAASQVVVADVVKAKTATDDSGRLVLKSATFDPTREATPSSVDRIPEGRLVRPSSEAALLLVQFQSGPTAREQEAVGNTGAAVLSYVPHHALLIRVKAAGDLTALREIPGVRWVGRFEPGYRINPSLASEMASRRESNFTSSSIGTIVVQLASTEDASALAAAVKESFIDASIELPREGSNLTRISAAEGTIPQLVGALIRDPAVLWVERYVPPILHNDNSVWIGQSYDAHGPEEAHAPDPKLYEFSATVWNHGLLGQGQIVGIADTELEFGMCFFADPLREVLLQQVAPPAALAADPLHRKILAFNYGSLDPNSALDSFRHGTHVAGSVAGDNLAHPAGTSAGHDTGDGMAPRAKIIFEDISPGVQDKCAGLLIVDLAPLLTQEYVSGARLSTNSWGTGANFYGSESVAVDGVVWAREDFSVFFSAGNEGVAGVSQESGAKNSIGVGATETYDATFHDEFGILTPENMLSFSSQGFMSDGRYKPDLTAPGSVVSSRFPVSYYSNASDPHCNPSDPQVCFPSFGGCYVTDTSQSCSSAGLSGTSMASPTAAGLAALARQYFTDGFYPSGSAAPANSRNPSAALMKAVLINGARNMIGHTYDRRGSGPHTDLGPLADAPGPKQGWGRVTLDDALYFGGDTRRLRIADVPNPAGLRTGATSTFQFNVSSSTEPLKVTLAWTDPPGSPSAGVALVNNLNLEITAPNGTVYRGNQWTADNIDVPGDKISAANPTAWDTVNNVEGVVIPSPAPGLYKARVIASNVPGYQSRFTQGYAAVVTGATGDCTAATPPGNPVARAIRFDHVRVTWDAVPGAIEYKILRNSDGCASPMSPAVIFSVAAGQTGYDDLTTVPASTYNYTVRAVMSADGCETSDSACASVPTLSPPTVSAVTPPDGLNNDPTLLTITGTGFVATPSVYLGTASQPQKYALAGVSLDSSTQLRATVPVNLQTGVYTLTVVNPDTQSGIKTSAFIVSAPLQTVTAFTADYDIVGRPDYTISLVDVQGTSLTSTISLGANSGPTDVAIRADHTLGVVPYWWPTEKVALINPLTRRVIQTVNLPTGRRGQGVALDRSGAYAYVMSRNSGTPAPAYLSKFDLTSRTFSSHVAIGQGILNAPFDDVAITPDGTKVCATNSFSGTVSVLRTSDMAVLATVTVGTTPTGLAVSSDSSKLYVANRDSSNVSVVSLSTYSVTKTIAISGAGQPFGLALSNSDTLLQVACLNGLVTLNPSTGATIRTGAMGTPFRRLAWLASTGKLYGLSYTTPSRVYRINPSTLALEMYGTGGNASAGMDVAEPKSPTIVSVSPASACKNGGVTVTITGSQFQGEVRDDANQIVQQRTRVYLGTAEVTRVTFVSSTQMTMVVPARAPGTVNVTVTNPSGKSATLTNGFRYLKFDCLSTP